MKTLLESILLELKLSKASTGKKLDFEPTFGELKEGDIIYFRGNVTQSLDETEYEVTKIEWTPTKSLKDFYTDKNPDTTETIYCEIVLRIKNTKNGAGTSIVVPHYVTYLAKGNENSNYFICATNYNTFCRLFRKE